MGILHNTTNGHHQRTSSQQFYNKFATSQCQSPTSRHVKMLQCGKFCPLVVTFFLQKVVELLWARPFVVFVAGVRSRCSCSGVWTLRVKCSSVFYHCKWSPIYGDFKGRELHKSFATALLFNALARVNPFEFFQRSLRRVLDLSKVKISWS